MNAETRDEVDHIHNQVDGLERRERKRRKQVCSLSEFTDILKCSESARQLENHATTNPLRPAVDAPG